MTKKILVVCTLVLLLTFLIIANVSAITGSIGNSRMILRLEPGETVEKYILVKNVNDVPITIDMEPIGDLADYVRLEKETFVLLPGQEKKAYFTIKAAKSGTTKTKINVRFSPQEGNGVGLSSTIIIIVDEADDNSDINDDNDNSGFSFNPTGKAIDSSNNPQEISPIKLLTISTIFLVIIFAALAIYYFKLNPKKSVGRSRG